jgi:hypothetical protein
MCQAKQFVDHLPERLGGVYVYGSGWFLVAPIEPEHEFDLLRLFAKFIVGALFEAATHGLVVDAEVEHLREVGQKAVAITAASTDEQHVWFRAFELPDSFLVIPHRAVVTTGPTCETGFRVGTKFPSTVGADGLVAAADQLLVDRGFAGTGQPLHQVVPLSHPSPATFPDRSRCAREHSPRQQVDPLGRVAGLEKARDCASRTRDDEHRPDFEEQIDDASGEAKRILDLRRDRQQLHRREEERVEEGVNVGLLRMAFEHVHQNRSDCIDHNGEDQHEQEAADETPMAFFPRCEPLQFLDDHLTAIL